MTTILRKYGESTVIVFELYEPDGIVIKTDAAHASGDTRIIKDEGTPANTANGFVNRGDGFYSLVLTAAEMEAARIAVKILDEGELWLTRVIVIETFGGASAQFPDSYGDIAAEIFRRDASLDEAASPVHSLNSLVLSGVSRIEFNDTTNELTVYRTDGTTVKYTRSATQGSNVEPITSLGVGT